LLTEERQANLARKEAAADAANERVARQKAIAEAEARAKFLQAEADRLMVPPPHTHTFDPPTPHV
jgi:hypothetical protein